MAGGGGTPVFSRSPRLRNRLLQEIGLFDAIDFCHFYTRRIDFNRQAIRLTREAGLPSFGTSDSHLLRQFGTTYSLIEAEFTVGSVLGAIREGRFKW